MAIQTFARTVIVSGVAAAEAYALLAPNAAGRYGLRSIAVQLLDSTATQAGLGVVASGFGTGTFSTSTNMINLATGLVDAAGPTIRSAATVQPVFNGDAGVALLTSQGASVVWTFDPTLVMEDVRYLVYNDGIAVGGQLSVRFELDTYV